MRFQCDTHFLGLMGASGRDVVEAAEARGEEAERLPGSGQAGRQANTTKLSCSGRFAENLKVGKGPSINDVTL